MHATQLIELFKVVDKQELQKFGKYLSTTYHNTNKAVYQLFLYIVNYAPHFTSSKLKKASVYNYLYGDEVLNDQKLNKLAYQLKTILQEFLIHLEIEKNQLLKDRLLVQVLEKRNHPAYAKHSRRSIKAIDQKTGQEKDIQDYLDLFQLNYTLWSDVNTQKIGSDLFTLKEANQHLDKFYFLNKLKIILEYESAKHIIAEKFDIAYQVELINLIKAHPNLTNNISISLFLKSLKLLASPNKDNYDDLKKSLFDKVALLPQKNARDIMIILNNYNSKLLGTNPIWATQESFELFQFGDKNELLLENGRIRDIEYANAIRVSLFIQKVDWANLFAEKYKPFLGPSIRAVTYVFVKALIYFNQQEFGQVIKLLNKVEFTEKLALNTAIQIRTLRLRALYDLWESNDYQPSKEILTITKLTNSFEGFIMRHKKIAVSKKKDYAQFTHFLRKIINCQKKQQQVEKKLLTISATLKNTSSVTLRPWLTIILYELKIYRKNHQFKNTKAELIFLSILRDVQHLRLGIRCP